MIDPFDPDWPDEPHLDPEQDPNLDLLNALDMGVIGVVKPRVDFVIVPREYPSWYESDNNAASPLEQDLA